VELPRYIGGKYFNWDKNYAEHFFNYLCEGLRKKGNPIPDGYSFEWRQDLYYYQGKKYKPYMLLTFPSDFAMKKCEGFLKFRKEFYIGRQRIGWIDVKVCETDIPHVRKLLTYRDCKFSGWLRFGGTHPKQKGTLYDSDDDDVGVKIRYDTLGQIVYEEEDSKTVYEQISNFPNEREWVVEYDNLSMTPDDDEVKNCSTYPKLMAYDIEVYSDNVRVFPNMKKREHCVFMISCVYQRTGDPSSRKYYALVYGDCNQISKERWESLKGAEIFKFDDELDLVDKFADLVNKHDVDVLTGYNIYDFDNPYLDTRLKLSLRKKWPKMGRLIDTDTYLDSQTWESNGYGFNSINYLKIPGRISVDMLPVIRREYKLMKYNLETVAMHFLKRGKHDVTPAEMFLSFEKNQKAVKEWSELIDSIQVEEKDIEPFRKSCESILKHVESELTISCDYLTDKETAKKWKEKRIERNEEIRKCIYANSFKVPKLTEEDLLNLPESVRKLKTTLEQRKNAWKEEFEKIYNIKELDEIRVVYSTREVKEELTMHDNLNDPANSPMYDRNDELNWCSGETWEHLVDVATESVNSSSIKLPDCLDGDTIAKLGVARFLMTRIIVYCLFDSDLCIELFEELNVWVGLIQMSSVVGVTPVDLFTRGQQIRCLSQLYDMAAKRGVILSKRESPDIFFNGGFVFNVVPGIYDGVMVEDFSSLYPSIMIAYNICYTTLLHPRDFDKLPEKEITTIPVPRPDTKADDGAEYDFVDDKGEDKNMHEDEEEDLVKERKNVVKKVLSDIFSDDKNYYFKYIQCNVDGVFHKEKEGLIPAILRMLIEERKAVRKLQEKYDKSELMWMILEKKQLAIKVSANSIFGFMGAGKKGKRSLIEGAMSTTATGRKLITQVNEEVEEKYGCNVVYGDSVTSDTPILCRLDGKTFLRTIDDLPSDKDWRTYKGDKEQRTPKEGLEVWSDKGFTGIRNIIRHKTNKRVFQVKTNSGIVKVTEDHSLLNEREEEVKPKDVKIGDKLLSKDLPMIGGDLSVRHSWASGLFYGSSFCKRDDGKPSWTLDHKKMSVLKRAGRKLLKSYPDLDFRIMPSLDIENGYCLCVTNVNKDFIEEWCKDFCDDKRKRKIPEWIWKSDYQTREEFWCGYGYAKKDYKKDKFIDTAEMFLLRVSLGHEICINKFYDGISGARKKYDKNQLDVIRKIEDLGLIDDYVYDLETENHHFGAGVGRLIVHNTDSSMFSKPGDDPSQYNATGKRLGKEMSEGFKDPLKLEFEKTMRMIALARKKYAGYVYNDNGSFKMDKSTGLPFLYLRGNILARRDNAIWLRKTYEKLMRMALDYEPLDTVIDYIIRCVEEFMNQEINHNDLVTVRSINSNYKNQNYFMKLFSDRLAKMGTPARPGERIGYLVVKPRNETEAKYIGNRMVTPAMYLASKHDKEPYVIDRLYYLGKQFMNALDQLFQAGYKNKLGDYSKIKYKKKTGRKWIGIESPVQLMVKMMTDGVSLEKLKESIKGVRREDKRGPVLSEKWETNGFAYPIPKEPHVDVSKVKEAFRRNRQRRLDEYNKKANKSPKSPHIPSNGSKIAMQFH
jgi:DNA polymerase elongation subunit (family B)